MGFAEYSNYDGLGLAELVKKKEIKPAELVEAAIERIERHNPRQGVRERHNAGCHGGSRSSRGAAGRMTEVPRIACRAV
jgi:Asp-tRNA(Asn)/Glu-tRNA(Gln) amidotransferase A subunit family amidase